MSNVGKIVVILALLAGIMPFLGFPAVFANWFTFGSGFIIASLVYLKETHAFHKQKKKDAPAQEDTFSENDQPAEGESDTTQYEQEQ